MLEYSKTILEKVSFDPFLFNKELNKAFKYLNSREQKDLINWCHENELIKENNSENNTIEKI